MSSFFQKFAARPQMESQLENTGGARCFQMESERSAVSAMAHNKFHFGYDERRVEKNILGAVLSMSRFSISIYFGQIDLFSTFNFFVSLEYVYGCQICQEKTLDVYKFLTINLVQTHIILHIAHRIHMDPPMVYLPTFG